MYLKDSRMERGASFQIFGFSWGFEFKVKKNIFDLLCGHGLKGKARVLWINMVK